MHYLHYLPLCGVMRMHPTLIHDILKTGALARSLRCARSHAGSLIRSFPGSWDTGVFLSNFKGVLNNCAFIDHVFTETGITARVVDLNRADILGGYQILMTGSSIMQHLYTDKLTNPK